MRVVRTLLQLCLPPKALAENVRPGLTLSWQGEQYACAACLPTISAKMNP